MRKREERLDSHCVVHEASQFFLSAIRRGACLRIAAIPRSAVIMSVTDGHAVTVLIHELNTDRVFGTGTGRAGAHRAVPSATGRVTDAA